MDALFVGKQVCVLRKSDVVANADPEAGVFSVEDRQLGGSGLAVVTFEEDDSAWDVDVEQVQLPVRSFDLTILVETETSVENLLFARDLFGNGTTNDVGASLFC